MHHFTNTSTTSHNAPFFDSQRCLCQILSQRGANFIAEPAPSRSGKVTPQESTTKVVHKLKRIIMKHILAHQDPNHGGLP